MDPEPLQRARSLLRPGAIFAGRICIPGLSQHDEDHDMMQPEADSVPSNYTLEVIRAVTDSLGQSYLLAHHEAYEDKQACYIDLRLDEDMGPAMTRDPQSSSQQQLPRVSLSYSDAETLCSGHIAPTTPGSSESSTPVPVAAIRGTVKQLAYGEDGFLLPSAVTHTFELAPAAPDHAVDLRAAIHLARQQLVCALESYLSLQENADNPLEDPMHQEGSAIRALLTQPQPEPSGWSAWFRVATLMAEDCAAWLRHTAATLDGLLFETNGEKAAVLGALVRAGDMCYCPRLLVVSLC